MPGKKRGRNTPQKRSKITDAQIRELKAGFAAFARSAHFEMLKPLTIQSLLSTGSKSKAFQSLTLARLAEIGIDGLVKAYDKLDGEALTSLSRFITGLIGKQGVPTGSADGFDDIDPGTPVMPTGTTLTENRMFPAQELKEVGIIEAAQRIKAAIERIRSSENYPSLASLTLGHFWDREWHAAPFEESLTIKQICELNIDNFLKKKSIGQRKISSLVQALEKAAESQPKTESDSEDARRDAPPRSPEHSRAHITWLFKAEFEIPSYCRSILRDYEMQAGLMTGSGVRLASVLELIPKNLSAGQFILLCMSSETESEELCRIFGLSSGEYVRLESAAGTALRELALKELPEIAGFWESMLAGPGTKEKDFFAGLIDPSFDTEFQAAIWRVLLRSFGAKTPEAFGVKLSGYFTASEHLLELALGQLISTLPKHNFQVIRELKILFPLIDQKILFDILKKRADQDSESSVWNVRQES